MSAQACQSAGEKNLKSSTLNMRKKAEVEKQLKLNGFGDKLLNLSLKLEIHLCSIRILVIESLTNRI
jgi:hypothetical protein